MDFQILYSFAETILHLFFPFMPGLSGDTITGVVPNLYLNEYGFAFVALGVLMYCAVQPGNSNGRFWNTYAVADDSSSAFDDALQQQKGLWYEILFLSLLPSPYFSVVLHCQFCIKVIIPSFLYCIK